MFSLFLILTHISKSLYLSAELFDYVSIFFDINEPAMDILFVCFLWFFVVVVFDFFFLQRAVMGPSVLQQVT